MTRPADPLFDQRIADWLEDDAIEAPDQVLATVLAALPSIPRRPASRVPWRPTTLPMLTGLVAAAVIGVLAVGGAFYVLQRDQPSVGGPSPTPSVVASPTVVPPRAASWTATASMTTVREGHTATLLPDGKVLVAGGRTVDDFRSSAELYDPKGETWTATGSMHTPRAGATATLLPNGKVLVAGGFNGDYRGWTSLDSAELYDPATGTWVVTGSLGTVRGWHTATLLPDGTVLVAGGAGNAAESGGLASAELYDPAAGTWTATVSMSVARFGHAATLLPDGTVLVVGDAPYQFESHSAVAELYNPRTRTWTAAGSMATPRAGAAATLLPNGTLLVAGGAGSSAELYDQNLRTWTATGSMLDDSPFGIVATLLPNGTALVAGASNSNSTPSDAESYDPTTGSWTLAEPMTRPREDFTATLLPGGTVLIAGGRQPFTLLGSTPSYAFADLFDPGTGR